MFKVVQCLMFALVIQCMQAFMPKMQAQVFQSSTLSFGTHLNARQISGTNTAGAVPILGKVTRGDGKGAMFLWCDTCVSKVDDDSSYIRNNVWPAGNGWLRMPTQVDETRYATYVAMALQGIKTQTQNDLLYYPRNTNPSGYLSGTDTTALSNRINARVRYSDTASMLSAYVRKSTLVYVNNPARTLNTSFRPSTTNGTRCSYTVAISSAVSVGQAIAYLEISADNSTWTTINSAGETSVALLNTKYYNLQGEIPANWYCRIRTALTLGGTLTFVSGQEVTY